MDAQFDEELIHLTQIGGVAMRVKQSRGGHRMANVDCDNLSAPASWQFENLDVFTVREGAEKQETSAFICNQLV